MKHGWTGGQYSLFRAVFGAYLLVHFLHLLPWAAEVFSSAGMLADAGHSPLFGLVPNVLAISDSPLAVQLLIASAAVSAVCFAVGWHDKPAAVWMWYVLACLFARNPLIANPALPYVGWMLLAHVFVPGRPWGSMAAHRREDPAGGWHMPVGVYAAAWIVLALSYSYSGYTKLLSPSWASGEMLGIVLENPLARDHFVRELLLALPSWVLASVTFFILYVELLFAPLALFRRLRPWLWGAMLVVQLGFLFLLNFADLTFGMLLIHLFTFDPVWLRNRRPAVQEWLYYDGDCGFCHRVVRFLLAEDPRAQFRFAPLGGERFVRAVPERERRRLPDSFVVVTDAGRVLIKSNAVVHLLQRLGGLWCLGGVVLGAAPRRWRNVLYDWVGANRQRLFERPATACPMVPAALRERFEI